MKKVYDSKISFFRTESIWTEVNGNEVRETELQREIELNWSENKSNITRPNSNKSKY